MKSLKKIIVKTTRFAFIRSNRYNFSQNLKDEEFTSFGFKDVKKEERQHLVNSVFHSVAGKYDVMNDAMSLGIHRIWKNEFVNSLGLLRPNIVFNENKNQKEEKLKVVDVAGGTGDIAFRIWERGNYFSKAYLTSFPLDITVIDINKSMLEVGKERLKEKKLPSEDFNWVECNAETLNFLQDNSCDIYTIAFGIRNCTNIDKVLKEAHRVLRKGGRFYCLEFSHVTNPLLNYIYNFHSFYVIPELGNLLANDRDSYKYLVESIRKFPNQDDFKRLIEDAGFNCVFYRNLSGGIVAIHSGTKID